MFLPKTRYAQSGDLSIAYQVVGVGRVDLVVVPGFVSHLELDWEEPASARYLQRLASFSRLIRFDKRGTGLSDRVVGTVSLEERVDDVRAVLDAVGSERAVLLGFSEGGPMSVMFAAMYPERTRGLILCGTYARHTAAPGYPWRPIVGPVERTIAEEQIRQCWGSEEFTRALLRQMAPAAERDPHLITQLSTFLRQSASPGAIVALNRMNAEIDVRDILSAIRVPTLVLHQRDEQFVTVENSRYLAANISGARLVELPGDNHVPWLGGTDMVVDEIEEFVTGTRSGAETERVLATVLFTDLVGSTERASELGDRAWADLLQRHRAITRREIYRFRGREVDCAGDGILATFDGPARAIRSACAIRDSVRSLGVEVRAGLHTGECEVVSDGVGGIAVHTGQRVSALARPGEVLVSSTVKDLVAGSGIRFEDRGAHALKGIPNEWHLYAVLEA